MCMKHLVIAALLCLCIHVNAQNNADAILGKWQSAEKNLIVDVYKAGNNFQARILWFYNPGNRLPETDVKNPDENLRSRPVVGMDVLSGLTYNQKQNRWVDGEIYDCTSGRTWDANVWLANDTTLNVRGFYHVRWLGKTMKFIRVD